MDEENKIEGQSESQSTDNQSPAEQPLEQPAEQTPEQHTEQGAEQQPEGQAEAAADHPVDQPAMQVAVDQPGNDDLATAERMGDAAGGVAAVEGPAGAGDGAGRTADAGGRRGGRGRWRAALTTAVVLAGFLALTGWGYVQYTARKQAETALENEYRRSFAELLTHVEAVANLTTKATVANTPGQTVQLLSDTWRESVSAQEELNRLPVTQPSLLRTSRFLNQLGDFSFVLARRAATGQTITDKDQKQLRSLSVESRALAGNLHSVFQATTASRYRWAAAVGGGLGTYGILTKPISLFTGRSAPKTPPSSVVSDGFNQISQKMGTVPSIIYDGPFSDQTERRRPAGLVGRDVSSDEATAVARRFVTGQAPTGAEMTLATTTNGRMPAYSFQVYPQGKSNSADMISVDVSRRGGYVLNMVNSRRVPAAALSLSQAVDKAKQFLTAQGFGTMMQTYVQEQANTAVVTFVGVQDGAIIYPDQIKVQVALDTGEVIGYDAQKFFMTHRTRTLGTPRLTEEQARRSIHDGLKTMASDTGRLALIPLDGGKEVLTYEFRGASDGTTYLIYVNADTGQEEKILQVLSTPGGTLTL